MRYETLSLSHQTLLAPRFKQLQWDISEYSFANVYLFRVTHDFQVVFSKDIYIKGKTRDGLSYLMPTVPLESIDWEDVEACLDGCDFLFPVPEQGVNILDPQKYRIISKEQDSDYLYTVKKLSTYPGRQLSGRRNLLKQFNEHYVDHHTIPLSSSNAKDALQLLELWQQEGGKPDPLTDYASCKEGLSLMQALNLNGRITYIRGKPAGFVLGEALNLKTYVIHFAKALREFKGIYQYIYHELAQSLEGNYDYINLEQDLGDPNLQKAKRSYFPDKLIPKLRVSLWKSKVY